MKNIQENFLEFIENVENIEENFNNLKITISDMKIRDNKHDFKLFLYFISCICSNYHHNPTFYSKIDQTLHFFKEDIKKYYSNLEIFNVFKESKRAILFLIKEGIMTIDEFIAKRIPNAYEFYQKYYLEYFAPEMKPFVNEKWFPKYNLSEYLTKEIPDDFDELRNKGENSSFICKLIREDLVEEFIVHFNKNCISSDATINPSIFETNSFLLERYNQAEKRIKLIEYAAFFGSIQIFTFLKNQNAELTPSLWFYAIHSKNAELIHCLEELNIIPITEENLYKECFKESIKCHHYEITNYFLNKYLQMDDIISKDTFIHSLKYYNFTFLQNEDMIKLSFCNLCHFDYYSLAKTLLVGKDVDINNQEVQNHIFE